MNPKKITYFLAVYKDVKCGYWTSFADFDCLVDQGRSVEEAIENSLTFLNAEVENRIENNIALPEASGAEAFLKKLDEADGTPVCLVPLTVYPPAKTARINITAKGDVLARLDDYIARHPEYNRSKLLVESALNFIASNP